jgi:predicted dehydrogenase
VAAAATFMSHGNEMWHPDPEFFYRPGGGPLFDMGPYYLSALVTLLRSVRYVVAMNGTAFPQRTITSEPRAGRTIEVEVPTHWTAALTFVSGITASLTASWDVWWHTHPHVEIYGSEGTVQLPNPGYYVKPALFRSREGDVWVEVAPESGLEVESRGIGLVDMARAIEDGTPHRASVELAYHVLDVMCSIEESAESGRRVEVRSAFL